MKVQIIDLNNYMGACLRATGTFLKFLEKTKTQKKKKIYLKSKVWR